jgi:hypothetical protein
MTRFFSIILVCKTRLSRIFNGSVETFRVTVMIHKCIHREVDMKIITKQGLALDIFVC